MSIRPEDMDKLFSAFQRLDEKRNSAIQGTGLGLDISRQFVELMGDHLKCDSVYGEGSDFHFDIVQKIIDSTPIGEFKERAADSGAGSGPYVPLFVAPEAKILVVDDNEMNLQVLKGLLRPTRVAIDTAMSGRECLKKMSEKAYHIVLLDHMMPEMDGIETLHELRKTDSETPALALTANAAMGGENYYISEGFQGYLSKPVDGRKLEEALQKFLPDELLREPEIGGSGDFEEEPVAGSEAGKISRLAEVEGIDPAEGVRCCGSPEAFLGALETFYLSIQDKSKEIEDAFEREDYKFYTIKVHALKSSARIIGAAKLSKLAEEMENAGNAGDTASIRENTDKLLKLYRSYEGRLSGIFVSEGGEDDSGLPPVDPETLEEAYAAIMEFAGQMDYDSVEMVLDSMKEYKLESEDERRMSEIKAALKQLDWEKVGKLAEV